MEFLGVVLIGNSIMKKILYVLFFLCICTLGNVQENKHLPEIQSAQEMQENGVSVSELQTKLLQKIEELTLYLIEQEQTIQELRQEVEQLRLDR